MEEGKTIQWLKEDRQNKTQKNKKIKQHWIAWNSKHKMKATIYIYIYIWDNFYNCHKI